MAMRREAQPTAEMRPIAMARRPRMKERIADELRRLIIAGTLAPGTVLRQEHLAQQLQVSRTPLREALIALEKEGLIVIAPSGAASVVALDTRDAREIMDVRELVDGLAARLLAERGLSEELDLELSAMAKEMRTTRSDKQRYLVLNADFHTTIIEATGHARLQQFVPLVRMASEVVYTRAQKEGRRLASSATEHTRILAAIRAGDGEEAERIARAHVRNASRHWLK
jgi:DNA-binding GntR family transcriptional regulator